MDPYALKQDNRKRFKDKQHAKQRHATPSDRKYRALKRQEQAHEDEQEAPPPPPSNEYRYHEDVTMAYGEQQDEERNTHANKRVRELLMNKDEGSGLNLDQGGLSKESQAAVTRKELEKMDVAGLNRVLGRSHTPDLVKHTNDPLAPPRQATKSQEKARKEPSPNKNVSTVPQDLKDDEDFLDGLI
ncbi:hypothetical protein ZYGR_0P03580 [Zygosaccharomyces rouxii]|uniref:ZYRO0E08756p n=2 Tax=Zygosaccharomyces rouxii TaxID=4956 RepID=C5E4U1_ZYGRC|nr:uncharacterized protein ZYRO0E08756g [Zygosaccharomyces rouxii]KAH9198092.1 hypothetical protein LQ764DRAFT_227733 [Zygosaccharomyces rouxii]GAV49712.1 hypothetical protein ZYGR_0P03580 [Zygosaccharomyces rouxii]CAR31052.1 ZYRO0E08756p [Zygosaccharomyces rouxii]